jgi:hypothetical protein
VSGDRRGALVTAAAAVALVVVGIVAGFIGLIEATALIRLGAVHISVGAVISGAANCALGLLAVWGLGSREAAALPALGWFVMVAVALFGPLPGGDILIPGSGWDVVSFAVAGAAGAALAGGLAGRVTSPNSSPDR